MFWFVLNLVCMALGIAYDGPSALVAFNAFVAGAWCCEIVDQRLRGAR